jgi:hypothetical protein
VAYAPELKIRRLHFVVARPVGKFDPRDAGTSLHGKSD